MTIGRMIRSSEVADEHGAASHTWRPSASLIYQPGVYYPRQDAHFP
jgi:hypothetical protein